MWISLLLPGTLQKCGSVAAAAAAACLPCTKEVLHEGNNMWHHKPVAWVNECFQE